jgi:hypothetical protein
MSDGVSTRTLSLAELPEKSRYRQLRSGCFRKPRFSCTQSDKPQRWIVPGVSTTRPELVQRLASRLHDPFENMRTGLYAIYQRIALHAPPKKQGLAIKAVTAWRLVPVLGCCSWGLLLVFCHRLSGVGCSHRQDLALDHAGEGGKREWRGINGNLPHGPLRGSKMTGARRSRPELPADLR